MQEHPHSELSAYPQTAAQQNDNNSVEAYNIRGGLFSIGPSLLLSVIHEMSDLADVKAFLENCPYIPESYRQDFRWAFSRAAAHKFTLRNVPLHKIDVDEFIYFILHDFNFTVLSSLPILKSLLYVIANNNSQPPDIIEILLRHALVPLLLSLFITPYHHTTTPRDTIHEYAMRVLIQLGLKSEPSLWQGSYSDEDFASLLRQCYFTDNYYSSLASFAILSRWLSGSDARRRLFSNVHLSLVFCIFKEDCFHSTLPHRLALLIESIRRMGMSFTPATMSAIIMSLNTVTEHFRRFTSTNSSRTLAQTNVLQNLMNQVKSQEDAAFVNQEIHYIDNNNETILHLLVGSEIESSQKEMDTILTSEEGHSMIEWPASNGQTLLHLAAFYNNCSAAEVLINHGADVNPTDNTFRTPVFIGSECGYLPIVQLLLQHDADINQADVYGRTPLFIASIRNHLPIVEFLIAHGADVNKADNEGNTPLLLASLNNRPSLVELLVNGGADVNKANGNKQTPLYLSSQSGYASIVEILLRHGADANEADKHGRTPLYIASHGGHVSTVGLLIKHGADVNKANNSSGETPLSLALSNKHFSVAELIATHGADVNKANKSKQIPLMLAAGEGYLSLVTYLVEHGADINAVDEEGQTPLYYASEYGHLSIVEYLVIHGADVNQPDAYGETPLHISFTGKHFPVVEFLIQHGADVNSGYNGRPFRQIALESGPPSIVHLLKEDEHASN